jgi:hypothetical protein
MANLYYSVQGSHLEREAINGNLKFFTG